MKHTAAQEMHKKLDAIYQFGTPYAIDCVNHRITDVYDIVMRAHHDSEPLRSTPVPKHGRANLRRAIERPE